MDRSSKYKEENRQILKESIEVAPFTAKIQRSSDGGMDRDRPRDPVFPVRIPALASPSLKAGHAHPHLVQSEKSNYFTTLSNSVVNEPPRLYASKEMMSYYDKVSIGAPGVVASVGAAAPGQAALSLGNYTPKGSLSKPPPLIKHQPEGGEGLAGKITEQLSQHATLRQQQHPGADRMERGSPVISPPSSTPHQHQQHQHLRAMPSLHRAPVFHPPTQLALERKEAAEREKERERERERAGFGGRLSPPTLTPIQPVSLAAAGSKTSAEQQKPPTLLPELRDVKGHGNAAALAAAVSAGEVVMSADVWRGDLSQERGRGRPQAAMASVIVRPSTSIRYDSPVGANKPGGPVPKDVSQGRLYPSTPQVECLRLGGGRVIQPSCHLDDVCPQPKKAAARGGPGPNSVYRAAASAAFGGQSRSSTATPELGYPGSARGEPPAHKTAMCGRALSHTGPGERQEGLGSRTTSPGGSLPQPGPSLTPTPSSACGPAQLQPYSPSFVHLKKHKAALAAAQSRTNHSTAPPSVPAGNVAPSDPVDRTVHSSPPPPPPSSYSQTSSSSVDSSSSASGRSTPGKSSPLPNGQSPAPTSTGGGPPSNYHKLKKAWLTRHSEEDRTTTATGSSVKADRPPSSSTGTGGTSHSTPMSDMIKPCTVNLSASTSSDLDLSRDSTSKAEREKQSEEKAAAAAEERKAAPASRRGSKRTYESGSESAGDDSDASESKMEGRAKRQPKPTYKKKQNDMAKRKGDSERDEDDTKANGIFRSAKEKTKLKLASSSKSPGGEGGGHGRRLTIET